MAEIVVYLDSIKDEITVNIPDYIGDLGAYRFAEMFNKSVLPVDALSFHKLQDIEVVNKMINSEPDLFVEPDVDVADALLDEFYDEYRPKFKDAIAVRRQDALKRKPKFSSPVVLAFAYSVVKKYPELIPLIEKPLYIDRAFKFIDGSYLHKIDRASKTPVLILRPGSMDGTGDVNLVNKWITECVDTALVLLAQYAATGEEKFLAIMDDWFIFKNYKLHREIAFGGKFVKTGFFLDAVGISSDITSRINLKDIGISIENGIYIPQGDIKIKKWIFNLCRDELGI